MVITNNHDYTYNGGEEWIHFRDVSLDKFMGVLHLIPDLSYTAPGCNVTTVPLSLPIKSGRDSEEYERLNLPGAPWAAIAEACIFEDVRDEDAYSKLGAQEKLVANEYWKKQDEIRSIFSLAIPAQVPALKHNINNIVGVLNIHGKKPNIFGTTYEYYQTYTALIYPIICQLSPYVKKYIDKHCAHLNESIVENTNI